MEIGEAVAVTVASTDGEDDCWACGEPLKEDPTPNDLAEAPDSIGKPENGIDNDSSKLGKNLGFRPQWQIAVPDDDGLGAPVTRDVEVVPGAHHLIPGNASLMKCPSILDLMEKSRGKISDDIGYDVNSAKNGIWLPANYGVRPDSVFGKKWGSYKHKSAYAIAAMKRAGAQFHDAHPDYSRKVLNTLRSLADKITLHSPENCGICKKQIQDKARPPYGLVGRLDKVSRQHRRFLSGPAQRWPIASGYFTSARSILMNMPTMEVL